MKINKEDISWDDEYGDLCVSCNYKDYDKLKQQILSNQEKAEKYDTCTAHHHDQHSCATLELQSIRYQEELEQENKQLKEIVEKIKELIDDECIFEDLEGYTHEYVDSDDLRELLADTTK